MSRTNKLFMAFSKGNKSSEEGAQFKRYIGVASVKLLGVNPTKSQLEDFYKTTIDNEPNYLGEIDNGGNKIKTVRIDFIVKVAEGKYKDSEGNDIDLINRVTFFIRNEYRFNRDKTKVQVIDKYGRTAWPTIEEAKNHIVPTVGGGNQARIDAGYRPAFVGEEELTEFLKAYLNIPSVEKWSNRQIVISLGLKIKLIRRPAAMAAVMPQAVAFSPPPKIPRKPSFATASLTPLERV